MGFELRACHLPRLCSLGMKDLLPPFLPNLCLRHLPVGGGGQLNCWYFASLRFSWGIPGCTAVLPPLSFLLFVGNKQASRQCGPALPTVKKQQNKTKPNPLERTKHPGSVVVSLPPPPPAPPHLRKVGTVGICSPIPAEKTCPL